LIGTGLTGERTLARARWRRQSREDEQEGKESHEVPFRSSSLRLKRPAFD
jgi:hypothetical protein